MPRSCQRVAQLRRTAEALGLRRVDRLRIAVLGSGSIPGRSVGSGEIRRIGGDHHSHRAFRYGGALVRDCRLAPALQRGAGAAERRCVARVAASRPQAAARRARSRAALAGSCIARYSDRMFVHGTGAVLLELSSR
jgi:hypothetical protein